MRPLVRLTGYRTSGVESVSAAAALLWEAISALRSILPLDLRWSIPKTARERAPVYSAGPIEKALAISGPKRPSEVIRGVPTHRVTLFGARNKLDLARIALGVSIRSDIKSAGGIVTSSPGVTLEMSLDSALADEKDVAALAERLLGALVCSFSLDAARAVPGAVLEEAPSSTHVRVGWLTFLPRRLGPVPEIPSSVTCVALEETGWVLRACPMIPAQQETAYLEALAYLRHTLGARVLLDGPAVAPPPRAPVSAPELSVPDVAPPPLVAPPGVPSYLIAPSPPVAPARPVFEPTAQPLSAAPQSFALAPLTTETSEIDISKLLRASLPFDPRKGPSQQASSQQAPTQQASSQQVSSQQAPTQQAPSQQAPTQQPSPRQALSQQAPSQPPVRSTNGRWIRFNPQTGEPLAEPFWQELASPGVAPPTEVERVSTGTVDVDPEMIARVLASRPRT